MFRLFFPKIDSLITTKVVPAGPIFFWAPAYIKSNFEKSITREKISELMSHTTGMSVVGKFLIWVPKIVLFDVQ